MNVLVINAVSLNGGDAAISEALTDSLQKQFGEETRFLFHDDNAAVARKYHTATNFAKRLHETIASVRGPRPLPGVWRRLQQRAFLISARCARTKFFFPVSRLLLTDEQRQALQEYRDADLIVATGGTYLVENYDFRSRLFECQVALSLGKPLCFYTQSVGPFAQPGNRTQLRSIWDRSLLVLLRDERSLQNAKEIGCRADNLKTSADAVFALSPAQFKDNRRAFLPGDGNPPRIAISVREWSHFKTNSAQEGMSRYRSAIQAVVTRLARSFNAHITFVSTCQGIPEYTYNDVGAASEIVKGLDADVQAQIKVDGEFRTTPQLMETLKGFDAVIGTRMHMCILALASGVPVLPIAYEFKTTELFQNLGMSEWIHDIETVDPKTLTDSFERFLACLPEIEAKQHQATLRERERAVAGAAAVKAAYDEVKKARP